MNPDTVIGSHEVDTIPAQSLLDGLARLYGRVFVIDSEGRIVWLSREMGDLCGDGGRDASFSVRALFPDSPEFWNQIAVRSQLKKQGYLTGMRVDLRDARGDVTPISLSLFTVRTGDAEEHVHVAIAQQVAEEARAVETPAAEAGMGDAILAGAPDAVLVVNEHGCISWANARIEALVGVSPEVLIDRPFAMLLSDAGGIEEFVASLAGTEEPTHCSLSLRHADGREIHASASAGALPSGDGRRSDTVFFLRDITDQRGTAAALEQMNGELEHCVHSLAHDLRSPLVALLGFSRLLRQDYALQLDDTGRHFIDRIEQAGRTMEELIRDLLEFSRIGQGGERCAMNDPRAVLRQIAAELKPRLDAAGAQLDIPEQPPQIYCDRTRLYQVFSNLIGNALDHMGECANPVIGVSVWDDEAGHQIEVRDNGRGIAPADHQRIFEVFQSLGPRSDGRRGSGIGLAIVKKIAETHSGRVWAESDLGAGAGFRVTFAHR